MAELEFEQSGPAVSLNDECICGVCVCVCIMDIRVYMTSCFPYLLNSKHETYFLSRSPFSLLHQIVNKCKLRRESEGL